jgi:hypothetical protein
MKKVRVTIAAALMMVAGFASAQQLVATSYVEQTVASPKLGTSVGVVFNNAIEVGGFYQQSTQRTASESVALPPRTEQAFAGAFVAYPITQANLVNVKLNVRVGVSNGQNFVITPAVKANLQATKKISLDAGLGVRSFRPTLMAGIKIKL